MAHYGKTAVSFFASDSSDYSDPFIDGSYEKARATPVETQRFRITAASTGTTITLSTWTTIHYVIVKNIGATYYAKLTYDTTDQASCDMRVGVEDWCKLVDVVAASNLVVTAENAAGTLVEIIVSGV
jgi:hypothetical protein